MNILEDSIRLVLYMRNNAIISKENDKLFFSKVEKLRKEKTGSETHRLLLLTLVREYGTFSLATLLKLFFGEGFQKRFSCEKLLNILQAHFHPTYVNDKSEHTPANMNIEVKDSPHKTFFMSCFGVQLQLSNGFIIHGFLDNDCFTEDVESSTIPFNKYYTLKEVLLQKNFHLDAAKEVERLREKTMGALVKEFISADLFQQRKLIVYFLMSKTYLYAYFLFDLLGSSCNCNDYMTMRSNQMLVRDSLPLALQAEFNEAIVHARNLSLNQKLDESKIPLEQQILMLKVSDQVKEKGLSKLKELKNRGEESSMKCKQYIDGLLKIPFGYYRKEPILKCRERLEELLAFLLQDQYRKDENIYLKWTFDEIWVFVNNVEKYHPPHNQPIIITPKFLLQEFGVKVTKAKQTEFLETEKEKENLKFASLLMTWNSEKKAILFEMKQLLQSVPQFIEKMEKKFEKTIYGHDDAKRELKQIAAQMVHGNLCNGYAIGFEGPPGVGKTSLAKSGLSDCLLDEDGTPRPFFMIALGGDVNGSTLSGHHYTYLGSIWGTIVQILMDAKCMNPIILFDEVDKISKTESGKEIVGVLTHILDATQNSMFQDKYFNGIPIDLSKVIFILSYNDVSLIDKILLDRVKRIAFKSLSNDEKRMICKNYFLPEILANHHLTGKVFMEDKVLSHIIDVYTYESGCRKLKELLQQVIGTINLKSLEHLSEGTSSIFPIHITIDDIDNIYLKLKHKVRDNQIEDLDSCEIGVINCLYANDFGKGGILKTVAKRIPSSGSSFLELKLTGLLDGMMKESFEVAKTLAWSMLDKETQDEITNTDKSCSSFGGIHIHCGDGSISKSGTSAGVAITVLIFSLLKNMPIPRNLAITGEVGLDGSVNEIGALDYKIIGGIKAGVTTFIFPEQNLHHYNLFQENNKSVIQNVKFYPVKSIHEVIQIVFKNSI
jgi:ATP-dependent Lon protease